jgi:hypothetical protein
MGHALIWLHRPSSLPEPILAPSRPAAGSHGAPARLTIDRSVYSQCSNWRCRTLLRRGTDGEAAAGRNRAPCGNCAHHHPRSRSTSSSNVVECESCGPACREAVHRVSVPALTASARTCVPPRTWPRPGRTNWRIAASNMRRRGQGTSRCVRGAPGAAALCRRPAFPPASAGGGIGDLLLPRRLDRPVRERLRRPQQPLGVSVRDPLQVRRAQRGGREQLAAGLVGRVGPVDGEHDPAGAEDHQGGQ